MRFCVNVEDGSVLFRSHVTDSYPILFRQIDDEMAKMISEGKVTGKQIAEAAIRKDMSQPGFDYQEYDKRRQAEKKSRCMSQREMIPVSENPVDVNEEAKPETTLTLADLKTDEPKRVRVKSDDSQKTAKDNGGY